MDVRGPDPQSLCKFHKVKGHQTNGCYQLKKNIELFIQESHMKKYIKGSSSRGPDESNSRGRDSLDSPRSKKGKDPFKWGEDQSICHTLNIIARGFVECDISSPTYKEQALQVMIIDGSLVNSMEGVLEASDAKIFFSEKDAAIIHPHNDDHVVITRSMQRLRYQNNFDRPVELCINPLSIFILEVSLLRKTHITTVGKEIPSC